MASSHHNHMLRRDHKGCNRMGRHHNHNRSDDLALDENRSHGKIDDQSLDEFHKREVIEDEVILHDRILRSGGQVSDLIHIYDRIRRMMSPMDDKCEKCGDQTLGVVFNRLHSRDGQVQGVSCMHDRNYDRARGVSHMD